MSKENSFCNNNQNSHTFQLVLKDIILISAAHPLWHATHNVCKVQNIDWFEFSQQIIHLFNKTNPYILVYFPKSKFKHHKKLLEYVMFTWHRIYVYYQKVALRWALSLCLHFSYFFASSYKEVIVVPGWQHSLLAEHLIRGNTSAEFWFCSVLK